MSFLSIFVGFFSVGSYKVYGELAGENESFLAATGSAGAVFNSLRFIWSALLDKYSYKKVYGSLLCL